MKHKGYEVCTNDYMIATCRDEAAAIIASQYGKKESGVLSVYEDQMNDVSWDVFDEGVYFIHVAERYLVVCV